MATDAIFEFNSSDGVHLFSFYKKTDCFPKQLIDMLQKILYELDIESKGKGRLNWPNVAAYIFNQIYINEYKALDNIKIWFKVKRGDSSFIYHILIEPEDEKYFNLNIELAKAINIKITTSYDQNVIYKGKIYDYQST